MIDSHCHLDFEAFHDHYSDLLDECASNLIDAIVIPGVSPTQWSSAAELCHLHSSERCRLYWAAGLHPWWIEQVDVSPEEFVSALKQQLPNIIAMGECGLDGMIDVSMDKQIRWFELQLQLACDLQLPLIVHLRKAHQPLLALLRRYRPPAGGVIHGFSGSLQQAQEFWALGFYLGVGGTITYERAIKTRTALAQMPLAALVLETDAPDMPLSGFQGQVNSPLQLPKVAECLAELRGESLQAVMAATTANCQRLFDF